MMWIYDFIFSLFYSFSHIFNSPYWIETNCCFIRKHSRIYSSHHRIENITYFCSSWIWTFHHTLHKLCSHNNRLSIFMSHLSDSSLIYRQLINWQLNTYISSSNHNSIWISADILKVFYSFLILNFWDNFYMRSTVIIQKLSDFFYIFSSSNERSSYISNSCLNSKQNISLILFNQCWKFYLHSWKIKMSPWTNLYICTNLNSNMIIKNLYYLSNCSTRVYDNLVSNR